MRAWRRGVQRDKEVGDQWEKVGGATEGVGERVEGRRVKGR